MEVAKEEEKQASDEAALQKAVEMLKPDEDDAEPEKQVVKKATVEKAKPTTPAKKEVVKKEVAKKPAATAAKATGLRVQLGAYRSDAEATREWKKAVAKHKTQLAGLKMMVQKVEIEGKGTMFRLQAGPVKSKDAAKVLCKELVAAGQGCFIAK
jgi:cell division septation protein DedD